MNLHKFSHSLLDIPFKDKGRDRDGCDCWGIVFIAYKELLGISLPTLTGYSSTQRLKELQVLIDTNQDQWHIIDKPKAFDCILLKIHDYNCHIGLMLDEKHFAHMERGVQVSVDTISSVLWKNRIEGFYRHVSRLGSI